MRCRSPRRGSKFEQGKPQGFEPRVSWLSFQWASLGLTERKILVRGRPELIVSIEMQADLFFVYAVDVLVITLTWSILTSRTRNLIWKNQIFKHRYLAGNRDLDMPGMGMPSGGVIPGLSRAERGLSLVGLLPPQGSVENFHPGQRTGSNCTKGTAFGCLTVWANATGSCLLTVLKRSSRVDNVRSGFWNFSLNKLDVQVIEMLTLKCPRLRNGHSLKGFH